MWYRDKSFWRNLLITVVIMGAMYTCTAYFAIQDRERQEEIHKRGEDDYGKMRHAVDSVRHQPLNKNNVNCHRKFVGKKVGEDNDPYDDPNFDDLVPDEEYDEEFIDRSTGDPELYKS
jgi:hypothetical protein